MSRMLSNTGTFLRLAVVAALVLSICGSEARGQKIVDQILTLVNGEIVTRTELLWSLALDPSAPSPAGPISSDLLRQKLEVMIEERLISQEATKLPGADITEQEINKKQAELVSQFGSEAAFRQRVESVGLSPEKLEDLLRGRILIDRFVDFRFRSFVFVSEQEIQRHYEQRLVPTVRESGQVPSPLDSVRPQIAELLKQQKINDELDRWLNTARQRADIVHLAEP